MSGKTLADAEILLRVMTPEDVPEVAAIEREAFSDPWSEAGFASELTQSYALYLTAHLKTDSAIVGYCGFLQSMEEAEIVNVAVREDCRGRGIGYRMLLDLMERGRDRGVRYFTLEVRRSNEPALRLYEKLGFVQVGFRKDFYEKPAEDAFILRAGS